MTIKYFLNTNYNKQQSTTKKALLARVLVSLKVSPMLLLILLTLGICPSLKAVELSTAPTAMRPKIELIARALKDTILLRWAPNNSLLWQEANKIGYMLERFTLIRNGQLLVVPERVLLTPMAQLPAPLANWEVAVKSNKYAAIAAQSLYGETFEAGNPKGVDLYSVVTKVKERDTRFSFALFSADVSPEVAKLSGLWYADANVKPNEKYLYRVFLANTLLKADTGFVYTSPSEFVPLPKPLGLKATFTNHKANLEWNHKYFTRTFNSYIVERSDDEGKTFRSISNEPIITLSQADRTDLDLFYASDSLPLNNVTYYYRVRGISSFGETSAPSDAIKGAGHLPISVIPHIIEGKELPNARVSLKWEFPAEKSAEISGFKVARSNNANTGFKYIADRIAVESREFIDEHPLPTNYYVIAAFNRFGDEVRPAPTLVMLADSIPPIPPVGLHGTIDKSGKVTLCWKPNTEEDIFGYRVYRANSASEEFSQMTSSPIKDSCFIDNISLNTLTKYIYYQLMAIDKTQNHSAFSEILKLKRPDTIPPVSPVIKDIKSSIEGVTLVWINSSSNDVQSQQLYRSVAGGKEWKLLANYVMPDSPTTYFDATADSTDYFSYTLIAKDMDGNESPPAQPVKGKKIDTGMKKGVDKLVANINTDAKTIELKWKKPEGNVARYLIYRAKDNEPMSLYKGVDGNSTSLSDDAVELNSKYSYSIKVIFVSGNQSLFCNPISVNY